MNQQDLPALQRIYLQTRAEKFHWLNQAELRASDFERDTEGERVWVAETARQIVGFVSVWEQENFIHHLFVLPRHARNKVGSALLSTCLQNMGRPAQLKCMTANSDALRFYQAMGWQTIDRGVTVNGEYQLLQSR
jgi:GNAT superfamily N-acetyltransferase